MYTMDKSPLMFESDEDSLLNGVNDSEYIEEQTENDSGISVMTANTECKTLKKLQKVMMGIPPPPSFTVPQLDAREILKLWRDHQNYRVTLSPGKVSESKIVSEHREMEVKTTKWPEVLGSEHYDVYYNRTDASEELARLFARYKERYVGAETSTSVNALFVRSPNRTASARKRARNRAWGHSPGRRLSHLARRRKAFSSASLCSVAGNSNPDKKMIMVEIKKVGNRQKKKNSVKKTKPTPKKKSPQDATYKRALFQSPDLKPGKGETQTPNTQGIHRSKRNLFVESSGDKEVNENGKRERPMLRMSPRKRVNRSLSFQESGPVFQQPSTSSANQNVLSGAHKQKMLWAATNALREEQMGMNHELFRSCMSVLFKACQKLWLTKMLFNQEGSTSENMLKLAKRFSVYAIEEISSDPTSNHMALVCSNIVKMGEKTLECLKSKVLSDTPKLKLLKSKVVLVEDVSHENGDSTKLNEPRCSSSNSKGRSQTPVKSSPSINTPKKICHLNNEPVSYSENQDPIYYNGIERQPLDSRLDTIDFTSPLTRSRKAFLLKNTPSKPCPSNTICNDSANTRTSKQNNSSVSTKENEDGMNFLQSTSSEVQLKIPSHLRKTPKKNVQIVIQSGNAVESLTDLEIKPYNYESPTTRSKTLHCPRNTPKKAEINARVTSKTVSYSNINDQIVNTNKGESLVNSIVNLNNSPPRLTRSRTPCKCTPTKLVHIKSSLLESTMCFTTDTKLSDNSTNISVDILQTKGIQKKNGPGANQGTLTVETKSSNYVSPITRSKPHNSACTPIKSEKNSSFTYETSSCRSIIGVMVNSSKSECIDNINSFSPRLTRSSASCINTPTKAAYYIKTSLSEPQRECIAETKESEYIQASPSKKELKDSCGNTPNKLRPTESISKFSNDLESIQTYKHRKKEDSEGKLKQPDLISPIRSKERFGSETVQEYQFQTDIMSRVNSDSEDIEGSTLNVNSAAIISPKRLRKVSHSKNTNFPKGQSNNKTADILTDETRSLDIILPKTRSKKSKRKKSVQANHVSCSEEIDPYQNNGNSSLIILHSPSKKNCPVNYPTKENDYNSSMNKSSTASKLKWLKGTKHKKNVDVSLVNSQQPHLILPTSRLRKSRISKGNRQKTILSDLCDVSVQCDATLNVDNKQPNNKMDPPDFISPRTRLRSYVHSKTPPKSSVFETSVVNILSVDPVLDQNPLKPKRRTKKFKSRMLSATKLKISKESVESPLKTPKVSSSIVKSVDVNETHNLRKTPSKVRFNVEDSSKSIPQSSRSLLSSHEDQNNFNFEVESNSPQFTLPITRSRRASLNAVSSFTLSPISNKLGSDKINSESSSFSSPCSSKKLQRKTFSSDNRPLHTASSGCGIETKGSMSQPIYDQLIDDNEIESETNKENFASIKQIDVAKNILRTSPKHLLSVENNVPFHLQLNPTYNESDPVRPCGLPDVQLEPPTLTAHWAELSEGASESSECPPSLIPHWENSPGNNTSLPDSIMTHWQSMSNKTTSDKIMFDFEDESYEINLPSDDDTTASSVCAPFDFPLMIDDSRSGFPSVFRRDSRDSFH